MAAYCVYGGECIGCMCCSDEKPDPYDDGYADQLYESMREEEMICANAN